MNFNFKFFLIKTIFRTVINSVWDSSASWSIRKLETGRFYTGGVKLHKVLIFNIFTRVSANHTNYCGFYII